MAGRHRLRGIARESRRALRTILYPPHCEICDEPVGDGTVLCEACKRTNRRLEPPFCNTCGEPFSGAIEGSFRCVNCADRSFSFEFAIGAWQNRGAVRSLLHKFKYSRREYLAQPLAEFLLPALEDERIDRNLDWTIVPVPLHPRRKRERGFNQAHEISRHFAQRSGMKLVDALHRTIYTTSQARLTRAKRLKNLSNAFRVKKDIAAHHSLEGVPVLLVDDVFTTGATTNACARTLRREAKVERVAVLTILRG